jgi:aminoglycoside phosphotransferase
VTAAARPAPLADRHLPDLQLLVDDEPLRAWLAGYGQVLARRSHVRYKPGTSCVAALQLQSGPAFLLTVAEPARSKLDKVVLKAPPGTVLAHDPARRLLLASFTADRDLPAVRKHEHNLRRLLGKDLITGSVATLVYNPERRWVGVASPGNGGPAVLLRAYRMPVFAEAVDRLAVAARASAVVQVPQLLKASHRCALLALEYLPGQPLDTALAAGIRGPVDLAAVGETLAGLHQINAADSVPADVSPSAETARLVAALLPDLAGRIASVTATLKAQAPNSASTALCHGDFSLDQVILGAGGGLGFIDWDRTGRGNPATDLASVAASGLAEETMQQLLTGYSRVRPVPDDLSWHVADARLRRLAEPFRQGSPTWAADIRHGLTLLEATLA